LQKRKKFPGKYFSKERIDSLLCRKELSNLKIFYFNLRRGKLKTHGSNLRNKKLPLKEGKA